MHADDPEVRARALDAFATSYWLPVSRYIQFKWRLDAERAADLTQEFFARTLEQGSLTRFDPARARFRTYVRLLVDGFVSNARKADHRLKRGGGLGPVPLEETLPDGQVRSHEPQVLDDRRRGVLSRVGAGALRGSGRRPACVGRGVRPRPALRRVPPLRSGRRARRVAALVRRHRRGARDLGGHRHQSPGGDAPRTLRGHVLERLREATGSDDEFEAEAKRLLGTRR